MAPTTGFITQKVKEAKVAAREVCKKSFEKKEAAFRRTPEKCYGSSEPAEIQMCIRETSRAFLKIIDICAPESGKRLRGQPNILVPPDNYPLRRQHPQSNTPVTSSSLPVALLGLHIYEFEETAHVREQVQAGFSGHIWDLFYYRLTLGAEAEPGIEIKDAKKEKKLHVNAVASASLIMDTGNPLPGGVIATFDVGKALTGPESDSVQFFKGVDVGVSLDKRRISYFGLGGRYPAETKQGLGVYLEASVDFAGFFR